MSRRHKPRDQVFAVIRLDDEAADLHDLVVVKEVVRTEEAAEAEVRRLTDLNAAKRCRYVWQPTRLLSFDEADGPGG